MADTEAATEVGAKAATEPTTGPGAQAATEADPEAATGPGAEPDTACGEAGVEEIVEALRGVADPCCRERGISVVDMGLLRDIRIGDDEAQIDIMLTSGWCPFQVDLIDEISEAAEQVPGIGRAEVRIRLDQVWSAERMAPDARAKLRFLPEPGEIGDRDDYVAARLLPMAPPAAHSPGANASAANLPTADASGANSTGANSTGANSTAATAPATDSPAIDSPAIDERPSDDP